MAAIRPQSEWIVATADDMRALGAAVGRVLEAGDVLSLIGPLGAGKTCFVQGLAVGLGVDPARRIASPTFTIVNEHPGRAPLYHVDLYRLEEEKELEQIGLREYLAGAGVAAVEWFDRFPSWKPTERLEIIFEHLPDDRRRVVFDVTGAALTERLERARLGSG
jgi:tRNA threonylcarbamoyladenosine biosynthesis protein TsaE